MTVDRLWDVKIHYLQDRMRGRNNWRCHDHPETAKFAGLNLDAYLARARTDQQPLQCKTPRTSPGNRSPLLQTRQAAKYWWQ
jgi:hypothetical protein